MFNRKASHIVHFFPKIIFPLEKQLEGGIFFPWLQNLQKVSVSTQDTGIYLITQGKSSSHHCKEGIKCQSPLKCSEKPNGGGFLQWATQKQTISSPFLEPFFQLALSDTLWMQAIKELIQFFLGVTEKPGDKINASVRSKINPSRQVTWHYNQATASYEKSCKFYLVSAGFKSFQSNRSQKYHLMTQYIAHA